MYGTVHFYVTNKNVQYCTLKYCGPYIVVLPLACMPSFIDLGYLEVAVCVGGCGFKPVTLTPNLVRLGCAVTMVC